MPHLKTLDGKVENMNQNLELEEFKSFGVNLGPTVPSSAPVSRMTDSSIGDESSISFPEFKSLPSELAQLRISKPEDSQQLPHFGGQSFHEFVAQDEGFNSCHYYCLRFFYIYQHFKVVSFNSIFENNNNGLACVITNFVCFLISVFDSSLLFQENLCTTAILL